MQRYVEWIIHHRVFVIVTTVLITVALVTQMRNLAVIMDTNTMLPQSHPYVVATNTVERVFGAKFVVLIGITPKQGDAFQPLVLEKVQRLTAAFQQTPSVVKANLLSLAARKAKSIQGNTDGLEVRPLLTTVPTTPEQATALKAALQANPVYLNTIISADGRMAALLVEFKDPHAAGHRSIMNAVRAVVDKERDPAVDILLGGMPVYLERLELYSERMVFLVPLAIILVGLIHFEAFRTIQGLLLPLVTALLAVVWGLGIMGAAGVPMDVFNATTPILILAVAAGHAVQILKRYYEEYHQLRATTNLSPSQANRLAVVQSIAHVGPVMLTAGIIAALGFLSLTVFEIRTVKTFGVFTGLGILSALILEMTFIPALRSLLKAPGEKEARREQEFTIWDRITDGITNLVTGSHRWLVYVGIAAFVLLGVSGMSRVIVDNTEKSFFAKSFPFVKDDEVLNAALGGTNRLYLLVEGGEEDAIKDPAVLKALDATQTFINSQPHVGKTISLADFIKRLNQAMNGDDAAAYRIPDTKDLISQYLLLYSMSGEPGDFDSYVDYGYTSATLTVLLKTDRSAYAKEFMAKVGAYAQSQFPANVRVSFGGNVPAPTALNEVMVRDKILNIIQIGTVVGLIASLVFRSLLAGLLVLTPLLLAVVANFGLMGWTGMELNIPNSLSSAMAVGIGADYAIYLLYRLREELAKGTDEVSAIRQVLRTAGKASLFVATAVAGGYGVLLFSFGFYIHIHLGILIANAMLVSVFAALTIIPLVTLLFRPQFLFAPKRLALRPATASLSMLVCSVAVTFSPGFAHAQALDAVTIMERNFVAIKSIGSTSDATFTLTNSSGQERVRKTFGTTKLQTNGRDNMRMTRFLSPPDVKGTVTLLIENGDKDDDIWVYLPALKKVRRLVSSNKKDSFVGTDFSYGDVIGHKVEEWNHTLLKEEEADGHSCYVIESTPKSDAIKESSGYVKRVGWIRKDNFVTIKGEFWDQGGQPLKTVKASDVQLVDKERGRWQPMRLEAANTQTEHKTVIQFEGFTVKPDIEDEFFTTRYMEQEP
jgi:uncharacterized protein